MANSITFTSAPFNKVTQFLPADGTNAKDILTVDAVYDRRVYGIAIFTDETAAKDVNLSLSDGTTTWKLTTVSIPLNSGNTNAVVPVDVFTHTQLSPYIKQRDAAGASYLNIPKGWSLRLNYNAAITAAKLANVVVNGESYA
jgi:hypothetical protein